ncbi:MAG: DUF5668 domain-containing protein [Candidatus Krumholzibacteriia bacterium]
MDSTRDHENSHPATAAALEGSTERAAPAGTGRAHSRARREDLPYKVPQLAAFLSLMPGLGQVYVGYYQQAFLHIATVAAIIALLASGDIPGLQPFFGLFLAFFWLFNMIDAARRASAYNRLLDGLAPEELPEHIALPAGGASRAWGVGLIVAGSILFLHTRFDVSLEWLQEWWPLGAVALGVYLLVKGWGPRRPAGT